MKNYFRFAVLCTVLLWVCGCRSSEPTAGSARYRRPPIVEADPEQIATQNLLADAKTQQLMGHDAEALALYRQVLRRDAHCGAAHYEVGRLMAEQMRMDSAIAHTQQAIADDPTNPWYHLQAATLYKLTPNHGTQEIGEWETLAKQHPETLEYYYEWSNACLRNNKPEQAIAALNRVEKIIGVTEPITLQKQKIWNAMGKPQQGVKEIEALALSRPHDAKYNAILAEGYMKSGDYKKAKACYDRVLAAEPDNEYIHISLAQYYQTTGNAEAAYKELKQGFAHPAMSTAAKVQLLAAFYGGEGFYTTYSKYSFDLLEDIMKESTDSLSYALLYGDVLMRQEKYAEAAHQFRMHLAVDSSKYEVWEALLICESMQPEREAEMLALARRAESLFPLHTLPYYLQAVAAMRQEHYEEALTLLQRCEQLGFSKGYLQRETYSLMAECYHALHQSDRCYSYYDKLLALSPDDAATLNNYAYYLSEEGQRLDEALDMARRAVKQEPHNATYLDTYAWVLYKMGRYREARTQMQKCLEADSHPSATLQEHWRKIQQAQ